MKKGLLSVFFVGLILMVVVACRQDSKHPTDLSRQFDSIVIDTMVSLMPDNDTATCAIRLNIKFDKGAKADIINQQILRSGLLTPDYLSLLEGRMSMKQAVDTFVALYIQDYRRFYPNVISEEKDSRKAIVKYFVSTKVEQGRKGIYVYKAAVSQTFGMQSTDFTIVRNIDQQTGKIVMLGDLLKKGYEQELCQLLTEKLRKDRNHKSEEELHDDKGRVSLTNNFIMGEDGLTFVYLQGEIDDRSQGEINIELPYSELSKLMK